MAPDPRPLRSRIDLAAVPSAVKWARLHAVEVLRGWEIPDGIVDDAVLIVSELASNAVRHAVPPCGLAMPEGRETAPACSLDLWLMNGHLFVAVHDPDRRAPVLRPASAGAEGGRGLQLVDQLSAAWGYSYPMPGAGKLVWARIPVPGRPLQPGEAAQDSRGAPPPCVVRAISQLARLAADP